jgi:hypothetical protein
LITISKPRGVTKIEGNVENNIVPWFEKEITICKSSVSNSVRLNLEHIDSISIVFNLAINKIAKDFKL